MANIKIMRAVVAHHQKVSQICTPALTDLLARSPVARTRPYRNAQASLPTASFSVPRFENASLIGHGQRWPIRVEPHHLG